jgi:DNA-binding CsgD family transcriptional regulator
VLRDKNAKRDATTQRLSAPPSRTPGEQRVLTELCRPVLSGRAFNPPSSVRAIAEALHVGESAVKQHLDHLYDKFGVYAEAGESRRVRLANEAIQCAAVTMRDLRESAPDPRQT